MHHDHDHLHDDLHHDVHQVWAGSRAMGVGLAAAADRPGKWIIVVKYVNYYYYYCLLLLIIIIVVKYVNYCNEHPHQNSMNIFFWCLDEDVMY